MADQGKRFLTIEHNLGQMLDDVRLAIRTVADSDFYPIYPGNLPTPDELEEPILKMPGGVNKMSDMNEKLVFDKPESVIDRATHYCPGCHHGIAHRLIGELMDDMDLPGKTLMTTSIGCSVFLYNYLNVDAVEAPHGRAPAVATGVKRARPDHFVFTYQGDGDLASIGMAEIMHAANRGEKDLRGLRQQHRLRYDWWADGPHHPCRSGHNNHSQWTLFDPRRCTHPYD